MSHVTEELYLHLRKRMGLSEAPAMCYVIFRPHARRIKAWLRLNINLDLRDALTQLAVVADRGLLDCDTLIWWQRFQKSRVTHRENPDSRVLEYICEQLGFSNVETDSRLEVFKKRSLTQQSKKFAAMEMWDVPVKECLK